MLLFLSVARLKEQENEIVIKRNGKNRRINVGGIAGSCFIGLCPGSRTAPVL